MSLFSNMPRPGETVSITTTYKNYVIGANKIRNNHYKNVKVATSSPVDPNLTFRIKTKNPRFPEAVISMRNVTEIISNRGVFKQTLEANNQKTVQVTGSKGNIYLVDVKDGEPVSCTCPGYHFRHKCRHLQEVKANL